MLYLYFISTRVSAVFSEISAAFTVLSGFEAYLGHVCLLYIVYIYENIHNCEIVLI